MNLVADEGVDGHIIARLRQDGHDMLDIAEIEPSISDDIVLSHANAQEALLLTEDKDFGESYSSPSVVCQPSPLA